MAGYFRKQNTDLVQLYVKELEQKMDKIVSRLNIIFEKNEVNEGTLRQRIRELTNLKELKYDTHQLRGNLYCYDIADTDAYKGISGIERYLIDKAKFDAKHKK